MFLSIDALTPMVSFIRRNTAMAAKFGAIQRQDIPEYPPEVVREALVNALLHADYSKHGCTIQVAIFDNRIEIINPGGLLFGLDLETALSGVSRLRNKIIGRIFRELGIIEQWGSGLGRMIRLCHELNIQQPLFEDLGTFFRVTLFPRTELPTKKEEWKQPILTHTKKHRKISAKEAQQIWDVTARTTSTRLKELVSKGYLTEVATSRFDPLKIFVLAKSSKSLMPLNQPQKLATKTWGARIFSHTLLRPQGFSMPKELKPFILLGLLMSCRSVSYMKIETSTAIFDNADILRP